MVVRRFSCSSRIAETSTILTIKTTTNALISNKKIDIGSDRFRGEFDSSSILGTIESGGNGGGNRGGVEGYEWFDCC